MGINKLLACSDRLKTDVCQPKIQTFRVIFTCHIHSFARKIFIYTVVARFIT